MDNPELGNPVIWRIMQLSLDYRAIVLQIALAQEVRRHPEVPNPPTNADIEALYVRRRETAAELELANRKLLCN